MAELTGAIATVNMISGLFKRKAKIATPDHPETPRGSVVWALGDVHGRLDLLQPLVEAIMADAHATSAERKVVIFLGDYVDRGSESRGVIRYLADLPSECGIEWRFLKGNHEEAMLGFLEDPSTGPRWCAYGGDAALRSFGLRPPELKHRVEAWTSVSMDLNHRLTPRERGFLQDLELSISVGDYFFVHAGARPGLSLDRQSERDLMWIRNSFLDSDFEFEKVVVHGHTPEREVYIDRRRIGVDTKAYESGMLSAVRLEGRARALLQTVLTGEGSVQVRCSNLTTADAIAV